MSNRLRFARNSALLSARGLSILAGLRSDAHVTQLESARQTNPHVFTLQALAETLGVSLDWLAGSNVPDPDPDTIRDHVAQVIARRGDGIRQRQVVGVEPSHGYLSKRDTEPTDAQTEGES